MEIEVVGWVVDGMFPDHSLILQAGAGGGAKSSLMLRLAIAAAKGESFMGRRCRRVPVLIVDYENPAWAVQDRINTMSGGEIVPDLFIWGTWCPEQPPLIGDPRLLEIATRDHPLMIIDPLRMGHAGKENESDEMSPVMRHLRSYAAAGATVIIVHHTAKAEGSDSRGSSSIKDAVDIAYVQEIQSDGSILLQCTKNRFGAKDRWTLLPNWDTGDFIVTESSEAKKRRADLEKLVQIITDNPGILQDDVCKKSGMGRTRVHGLLKSGIGELWEERETRASGRKSLHYYRVPEKRVHGEYSGIPPRSTGVPPSLEGYTGTGPLETGELQ